MLLINVVKVDAILASSFMAAANSLRVSKVPGALSTRLATSFVIVEPAQPLTEFIRLVFAVAFVSTLDSKYPELAVMLLSDESALD